MQGAKLIPLVASIAIGLGIRFLIPAPEGLTTPAWSLLAIFVSTIAGMPWLILQPNFNLRSSSSSDRRSEGNILNYGLSCD